MADELISRESFMRTLKYHGANVLISGNKVMERLPGYNPISALNGYELCLKDVSEILAGFPASLRPKGEWEITDIEHAYGSKCYHCPECGEDEWRYDVANFCPNCGADMRRDVDGN